MSKKKEKAEVKEKGQWKIKSGERQEPD